MLREKIDTYSFGFPASQSGAEVSILEKLFTPEEAEVGLGLSIMPEPLEVIAERMNRNPVPLGEIIAGMVKKGTAFKSRSAEGVTCFHAAPFMLGFAEATAGNMDHDLAELYEQHEETGFLDHYRKLPLKTLIRFIPVDEALSSSSTASTVAPYNKIEEILRSKKTIAAIPCYCRDKAKILGKGCDKPIADACWVFDWIADSFVERGHARSLSLEEALELQRGFEEAGLVNFPTNLKDTLALCHCCGDCCIAFRAIKALPKPAQEIVSDYYMTVNADECNGCEACIDRCPMDAMAMGESPVGVVAIDLDRCIGCGVCISACTMDALLMQEKSEEQKSKKPVDIMEFVADMSKARGTGATPIFSVGA